MRQRAPIPRGAPARSGWRRSAAVRLLAAAAVVAPACSRETIDERARDTAEKIQASMADVDAIPLGQRVDPSVVAEVQRNLTAIHEYQGEVDGQLDSVTVNAVEAFQRTVGLEDNGIITPETRRKLAAAAAAAAPVAR